MADESKTQTLAGAVEGGMPTASLHPGGTLGRYRLRSLLGNGGMGIVFLADDPTLDRTVAVKVLFPTLATSDDDRLIQEGQVMAKLNHPNVVRIYDVGREGTTSFVAMEHVRGPTLKAWIEEQPRGVDEVIDVFLQAGRGLAAAHRAGLVHRDFKPANVLIDDEGRVVVTDFGLAQRADATAASTNPRFPSLAKLEQTASEDAGICGTPAYMSPEQFAGARADARSDVFSFCVALWRALYGEPPFVGQSWGELAQATRRGVIVEPARATRVPAYVRAALERGLRVDPAARWPSMEPLLEALAADPSRRRWRVVRFAAAIVAVAVASALTAGWLSARRRSAEAACGTSRPRFAGLWDDAGRRRVRDAITATGEPQAGRVFDAVARGLDQRVEQWESMRRDSCEATRVRHEQSDSALDLRAACLDRKAAELEAFIGQLRAPTKATVYGALDALVSVGDVSVCRDAVVLSRHVPLPSDAARRQAIAALEASLLRLRTIVDFDQPLADAKEAQARIEEARALKYPPLTALALFVAARNEAVATHSVEAQRLLESAIVEAEAGGDDDLRFDLERELGVIVGLDLERFEEGMHHLERAQALNERSDGGPRREARLLDAMAELFERWGRTADGERIARRALALASEPGSVPLDRVRPLFTLSGVYTSSDRAPEAKRLLDEAIAIIERDLGPTHPTVGSALLYRGNAERQMHQWDAARRDIDRGVAVAQAAYGPDSFQAGVALANRAMLLEGRKQFAEAERDMRAAYAIYAAHYGRDHVRTVRMLFRIGNTLVSARRLDEAEPVLHQALDGLVRALGKNHRFVSDTYYELGKLEEKRKNLPAAVAHYTSAVEVLRASEGPSSKLLRRVYEARADMETDLGRYADAWKDYEAALAVTGDDPTGGSHRASVEASYAESLVKGGKRADALPHALRAREILAAIGEREKDYFAEVDQFIAQNFPERAKAAAARP